MHPKCAKHGSLFQITAWGRLINPGRPAKKVQGPVIFGVVECLSFDSSLASSTPGRPLRRERQVEAPFSLGAAKSISHWDPSWPPTEENTRCTSTNGNKLLSWGRSGRWPLSDCFIKLCWLLLICFFIIILGRYCWKEHLFSGSTYCAKFLTKRMINQINESLKVMNIQ